MIPLQTLIWYVVSGLILALVQLNLSYIAVENVTPDTLVILTIFIALRHGQFSGLLAGYMLGLFFDIISNDTLGTNALSKMMAGFVAGFFYDEQKELQDSIGSFRFLGYTALATLVHNFIYYFFYVQQSALSFTQFFLRDGIAASLYTTVLAALVMLVSARKQRW